MDACASAVEIGRRAIPSDVNEILPVFDKTILLDRFANMVGKLGIIVDSWVVFHKEIKQAIAGKTPDFWYRRSHCKSVIYNPYNRTSSIDVDTASDYVFRRIEHNCPYIMDSVQV